jgi:ADP-glucose pyrophosphorylase
VIVEEGVSVVDSVVLGQSHVQANLEKAIVDIDVHVDVPAIGRDNPVQRTIICFRRFRVGILLGMRRG